MAFEHDIQNLVHGRSYEATTQLPLVGSQTISWWMTPLQWYAEAMWWLFGLLRDLEPAAIWVFENIDYIGRTIWNIAWTASVTWILYRIYQVYKIPVPALEVILGFDIPPVPDVALSTITHDSVLLYWKPPENYHSPLRHFIQINGIKVGEFNRNDVSVTLTGLVPGNYYGIRAIATNAAGFSSFSRLIRIQTIPLTGATAPKLLAAAAERRALAQKQKESTSGRQSTTSDNEHTNGQPSNSGHGGDEYESEETVAFLTKKLNSLRRQQEEIDRQNAEELAENERVKAAGLKEIAELRQKVEEKEKAHLEFKKQVNELEKQCKAAQRKKSAKERQLQQRKAESQKKRDEVIRWKAEIIEMRENTQAMQKEKAELAEAHEKYMASMRQTIDEGNADIKVLEEEIRVWGVKIKALEDQKRKNDDEQNEEEREAEKRERDEEEAHEKRIQEYQAQIATLYKAHQQAESEARKIDERLSFLLNKRAKEPHMFTPIPGLDFPASAAVHAPRRMRQGASRASTISQSSSGYPNHNSTLNSISSMSPIYSSTSPFFNVNNGMAVAGGPEHSTMSQREVEMLTGGALMSPTANALIPSNLLRDDDPTSHAFNFPSQRGMESGMTTHTLNTYMSSNVDSNSQDPQSPLSVNSRSPSLMSSPHESVHNPLSYYSSRDQGTDIDRRSINSTSSPFAPGLPAETNALNGRRLTGLFNFNRQRGKASIDESPPLGTLKQGQSQSFPRNLDQGPLDPIGSARRRLGSGTWTNPMSNFLARNIVGSSTTGDGDPTLRPSLGLTRRSRLHMFGTKLEPSDPLVPIHRSASPRPSSTYSFENALPRPSSDSQPFGWGPSDGTHQRSSPLVADWSSIGGPWSRSQSRRASMQHGSTSNLSLGSTPLDPDDYSSSYASGISPPAPIGTGRSKARQSALTPKLNPAAPSFTTRLFSRNEAKKSTNSKGKEIEKAKDTESDYGPEDSSPPTSRLSRDARSIATATSESHDSLDYALSASASDSANNVVPKETLMQRITRKSSSSKFNVPWSKERGSLFSKKAGEPSTPGEVDEDASSDQQLGKSLDSASSTPQHEKGGRPSLSWSRVMRKAKKGEKEASESSERASETETGDDDEAQ
ncbi:hypothetical protein MMC26_007014 [Xylographa opegraphella]|nr:hypothetical protein [Xylographa opegraphella]